MDANAKISGAHFADIMGVSKRTLAVWENSGKYKVERDGQGNSFFYLSSLMDIPEIKEMALSNWEEEM